MRNILFMGKILASVTHEMQNVMAIIKESGALTQDILKINGPPRMKHGDKLTAALVNIQEQVGRGRDLMLMLNGFAHAAEDYPEQSDLLRFTRQICVLAGRMVRLKECLLQTDLEGAPLPVQGNALLLMQGIYLGIAAVLAGCEAGDIISVTCPGITTEPGNAGTAVLRIRADTNRLVPDSAALIPILEETGAQYRASEGMLELCYVPSSTQQDAR